MSEKKTSLSERFAEIKKKHSTKEPVETPEEKAKAEVQAQMLDMQLGFIGKSLRDAEQQRKEFAEGYKQRNPDATIGKVGEKVLYGTKEPRSTVVRTPQGEVSLDPNNPLTQSILGADEAEVERTAQGAANRKKVSEIFGDPTVTDYSSQAIRTAFDYVEELPKNERGEIEVGGIAYTPTEVAQSLVPHVTDIMSGKLFGANAKYRDDWARSMGYDGIDGYLAAMDERLAALQDKMEGLADKSIESRATRGFVAPHAMAQEDAIGMKAVRDARDKIAAMRNGSWQLGRGFVEGFDLRNALSGGLTGVVSEVGERQLINKIKDGKELTPAEQLQLDVIDIQSELDMLDDARGVSFWRNTGRYLGSTAEVMSQMAMTMPLARGMVKPLELGIKVAWDTTKKAGRKSIARGIGQGIFEGLKVTGKGLANLGQYTLAGTLLSPLQPSTYSRFLEKRNAQYSYHNGKLEYMPTNTWEDFINTTIEQGTELSSELFGIKLAEVMGMTLKGLGRVIGLQKMSRKTGLFNVEASKIFGWKKPQSLRYIEQNLGFSGDFISEGVSESWGDFSAELLKSVVTGDGHFEEFKNPSFWATTFAVSGIFGGAMSMASYASGYRGYLRDMRVLGKKKADALSHISHTNLKNALISLSSGDSIADATKALAELDWSAYDMTERGYAMDYLRTEAMQQVIMGENAESARLVEFGHKAAVLENLAYKGTKNIVYVQDTDGNLYYLLEGNVKDKEAMLTVMTVEGKKMPLHAGKVQGVSPMSITDATTQMYQSSFNVGVAMDRLDDAIETMMNMENPSVEEIRNVAKTIGITIPDVGGVITLVDGRQMIVESVNSNIGIIASYANEAGEMEMVQVHVDHILSNDANIAEAQRLQMANNALEITEAALDAEAIESGDTGEGAIVTLPNGNKGTIVGYNEDGTVMVDVNPNSRGRIAEMAIETYTREEIEAANPTPAIPEATATEGKDAISAEMEATANAVVEAKPIPMKDGEVDYDAITDVEQFAEVFTSEMGDREAAANAVVAMRDGLVAEMTANVQRENEAKTPNDIIRLRKENRQLAERIAFYDKVINKMLPEESVKEDSIATTTYGLEENELSEQLTPEVRELLDNVAIGLGVHVVFEEEVRTDTGAYANADINGNKVRIAWRNRDKALSFLIGHEFTHRMQDISPETYAKLKDAVKAYVGEARWNQYLGAMIATYEAAGYTIVEESTKEAQDAPQRKEVSITTIEDEIIADEIGKIVEDENAFKAFVSSEDVREKRTVLEAIKAFIENIIAKFRGIPKKVAQYENMTAILDTLIMESVKLGKTAKETAEVSTAEMATKEAEVSESTERLREQGAIVNAERGDVRYSIADVLTGDQREQAIADLMRVTGRSRRTVLNYLKAEESLANIILSGDNKAFLDIQVDESVPSIWSNSDYPQGTVEFSNICRKRLPFTMIYQRLQKDFPNTVFDASSLESIRQTLIANGEEVACGLCFVEDRRQLLGEIGESFIKALKGEAVELNEKQQEAIARMRESGDTYIPNLYELITLDGMKILRKEHREIANAFVAYNNARGMQAGRLFQAYSAYHRDILNYDAKKVAKINNAGGLRIFSFSDFEAHHLIDLVQVLTDCAAKGIKVQGYTKVPQFAKAVKDTKMKVNRSLIAKAKGVVDADYIPQEGEAVSPNVVNGKRLLFDTVEGIDVTNPNFFDSTDSKNVGNILVGISDEHIRIAMLDPFVDYIIGFHTGLSEAIREQKGIAGWTNYKYTQLEKVLKDGKLVNADKHGINIYTEVLTPEIKTERQFVRKYLKVCEEKGWIPKYHRFLNKSKRGKFIYTKGYYKLLLDFKMFDANGRILPQEVVVPVFDNEVNARILEEYVEGEKAKAPNDELYEKVVDAMVERGVLTEAQVGEAMSQPKFSLQVSAEELAEIEAERQSIIETAKANGTYLKAPNGKDTNLTPEQWVDVRTSRFKKWFGDWELAALWKQIQNLKTIFIPSANLTINDAEEIYNNIGVVENVTDGRKVHFVHGTFGKIVRHKGYDTKQLIPLIAEVFQTSIPIGFEKEIKKEGHKDHSSNFVGYHHYLGKINSEGGEYYVRFTVQQIKTNPSKKKKEGFTPNQLHSTFVSDIEIYSTDNRVVSGNSPATANDDAINLDTKLETFLNNAKSSYENSSKIVDENGEPKVVWHGTPKGGFTVFNTNPKGKTQGTGAWFASDRSNAVTYSGRNYVEFNTPSTIEGLYYLIENNEAYENIKIKEAFYIQDEEGNEWKYETLQELENDGWEDYTSEDIRKEYILYDGLSYMGTYTVAEESDMLNDAVAIAENAEIPMLYEVFLNIREPFIVDAEGKNWQELDLGSTDATAREGRYGGYDGTIIKNVEDGGDVAAYTTTDYIVHNPNQIKSATNNVGTYNVNNPDIRYSLITPEMDAAYLDAVERGDMATAQRMVMEAAEKAGYINDESWRMNHRAPRKDEENANPFNTEKIVPEDFWEHPEWYTNIRNSSETRESYHAMKPAIDKYKRLMAEGKTEEAENVTITMYRGVDKTANKREASFRNGDWITPSRSYALLSAPYGKARVISQEVKLKDIWWDGNSINEWGYDDGANYGYRDTKNNRKLLDPVTYDDAGNVIPLSERFNPRKDDIRYSMIRPSGEEVTFDNFFEDTSATFTPIPKGEVPQREPDYVSMRKDGNGVSSRYWYGEDERGKYVVRASDHWSYITYTNLGVEEFEKDPYNRRYTPIASCRWGMDARDITGGKSLSEVGRDFPDVRAEFKEKYDIEGVVYGKAYLDEFTKWEDKKVRFSIIGEIGAANLDTYGRYGSPMLALEFAREFEAEGKSAKDIRLATNWERGTDGKWRYEILDGVYNHPTDEDITAKEYRLADILDNADLYKAYPYLKDIKVEYKPKMKSRGTYYNGVIELNASRTPEQINSTLLHEVQHAIQHIEMFATGGNTDMFKDQEVINQLMREIETLGVDFRNTSNANIIRKAYLIYQLVKRGINIDSIDSKAFKAYRRLAGEVESRNVQKRMGMTEAQRLETLLSATEDVARKDQEMLFDEYNASAAIADNDMEVTYAPRYSINSSDIPFFNDENGEVIYFDNTDVAQDFVEDDAPRQVVRRDVTEEVVRAYLKGKYLTRKERIRKEARQQIAVARQLYKEADIRRREGIASQRSNAGKVEYILGDTPYESLGFEDMALVAIAEGDVKIRWEDDGTRRGLASELGLSDGERKSYGQITKGATLTFEAFVHKWWESLGGYEKGIDTQDLRNALIEALMTANTANRALEILRKKYDHAEEEMNNAIYDIESERDRLLAAEDAAYAEQERELQNPATMRYYVESYASNILFSDDLNTISRTIREMDAKIRATEEKVVNARNSREKRTEAIREMQESLAEAKYVLLEALSTYENLGFRRAEVQRLVDAVKGARTLRDISKVRTKVESILLNASIREKRNMMNKLIQLRLPNGELLETFVGTMVHDNRMSATDGKRIISDMWKGQNAKGVSVAKMVDDDTRILLENIRGMVMTIHKGHFVKEEVDGEEVRRYIPAAENTMDIPSSLEANEKRMLELIEKEIGGTITAEERTELEARSVYPAYLFVVLGKQNVAQKRKEIEELFERIKAKREGDYAREEREQDYAMLEQLQREHNECKKLYEQALDDFNDSINNIIIGGRISLREFRENKEKHKAEVIRMAIDAMGIEDKNINTAQPTRTEEAMAKYWRGLLNVTYWTFDTTLREIDRNAPNGEGKFYEYIMGRYVKAVNGLQVRTEQHIETLGDAVCDIWYRGEKISPQKALKKVIEKADATSLGIIMRYKVGEKKETPVVRQLRISNGLFVLAMWGQEQYRTIMMKHGIDEDFIAEVESRIREIDERYITLKDWVIKTILPATREEYNKTHVELFGASMDNIANYFPAKVMEGYREVDMSKAESGLPSTMTGSIIKRQPHNNMIDASQSFFSVLLGHLQNMDHWASFSPLIEDINAILSNNDFKNRANTLFPGTDANRGGTGSLVQILKDTAAIAMDCYRVKHAAADELLGMMAGAWTASNISWRLSTAIKQLSGSVAFLTSEIDGVTQIMWLKNMATFIDAMKWASEMSPMFRKRWNGRFAGNEVLQQYAASQSKGMDLRKGKTSRAIDKVEDFVRFLTLEVGMLPNAAVDAVVVATGMKTIYDATLRKVTNGKPETATQEQKDIAMMKAEIFANETQQSAEGAYLSVPQAQKSAATTMATTYMNASYAAHRMRVGGVQEIIRAIRAKENPMSGVSRLLTGVVIDASFVAMSYLGRGLWNIILDAIDYEDDDESQINWKDYGIDVVISLGTGGILGGNVIQSLVSGYGVTALPAATEFFKDLKKATGISAKDIAKIKNGGVYGEDWKIDISLYAIGNMLLKYRYGVDAETYINMVRGVENICRDGDPLGTLQILNSPASTVNILVGRRRKGETVKEYVERRMRYEVIGKVPDFEDIYDEEIHYIGDGILDRVGGARDYKLRSLYKEYAERQYNAVYNKMLTAAERAEYEILEQEYLEVCEALGWKPDRQPTLDTTKVDIPPQYAWKYHKVKGIATEMNKMRINMDRFVGTDSTYLEMLKARQAKKRELIETYNEYLR